jgi:hypothetical protein
MSILSDIFNPTLLIFLGITLLLLALLVLYFENKMRDQNHKIASMLSLVSSLAEETGMIKTHVTHMINGDIPVSNNTMKDTRVNMSQDIKYFDPNLITVSDNDTDDDDDENSSNDNDDDSDNSEDDDSDSDDSDLDIENMDDLLDNDKNKNITINEINDNDIKVLNLDNLDNECFNMEKENEDDDDDILEDLNFDKLSDTDSDNDDENQDDTKSTLELNQNNNLKSIKITTLEEDKMPQEVIDYKKLSLNKLKSIVVERGLVQDSSKLKKHELLKLLNVE